MATGGGRSGDVFAKRGKMVSLGKLPRSVRSTHYLCPSWQWRLYCTCSLPRYSIIKVAGERILGWWEDLNSKEQGASTAVFVPGPMSP